MKDVYLALGVATVGGIVYHTGQKAITADVNPMILLIGVYLVAILLAVVAIPFFRISGQPESMQHVLSWPVLSVGIGAAPHAVSAGRLLFAAATD